MLADPKLMNGTPRRVFKRLHYPIEVILVCARWYVAYPLSLRHLEEMIAERGVAVDHSTIHRWAIEITKTLKFLSPHCALLAPSCTGCVGPQGLEIIVALYKIGAHFL